MSKTLIDTSTLAEHLTDSDWVVIDCRFDLADPARGEQLYLASHIPGARYAHLDNDLSGQKTGRNGRHPLPTVAQMEERFGRLGISSTSRVVVYDADSGMYAARLWWMLRFMSHDRVAVLDGGFAAWAEEGRPVRGGDEQWTPQTFQGVAREAWRVNVGAIEEGLTRSSRVLVDARSEERFRGENETIDPRAGHIPGARNHFFQGNLAPDKRFKSADDLRTMWRNTLGSSRVEDVVMYCGSGVTACHNLLALEHAGLGSARLYPGSWSEWSSDPSRPAETESKT